MFFIVGVGRSGTTLLRVLLNSHPKVAIPPESHFIPSMLRRRSEFERNGRLDVDLFLRELNKSRAFTRWSLETDTTRLELASARTVEDGIEGLYRCFAKREGKLLFGDKTPAYITAMQTLDKAFPNSRFIHIFRDGRDVSLSLLEIGEWGPRSIEDAALFWMLRIRRGRRHGSRMGARYLEVRYEDLVSQPRDECAKICRFLDVPFDEGMFDYPGRFGDLLGLDPHTHKNLRMLPIQGLRNYRREMSLEDQMRFVAIAGKTLREFGYEVGDRVPLLHRVKGTITRVVDVAWRRPRMGLLGVVKSFILRGR